MKPLKLVDPNFLILLIVSVVFIWIELKVCKEPSMGWSLNTTVDDLLKKEFDFYRDKKEPHPIFKEYKLNYIPYQHQDIIDQWREIH